MSDEFKVRNMLILDEDRQKTITIRNEKFIIRAIFSTDKKEIARQKAYAFGGFPRNSYSTEDQYVIERDATVDHAIIESPEWWSSSDDCPDEEVLNKLHEEITKWSFSFQEKLKKNKLNKRSTKDKIPV